MNAPMPNGTLVLGDRVYEVRVVPGDRVLSAVMTVALDGQFVGSLVVPGWRGVSLGFSDGIGYLWSARQMIVLPGTAKEELRVIEIDEDLLFVFCVRGGWLVVCETSIRLLVDGGEASRVELGDVVDTATWDGGLLKVLDSSGEMVLLRVDGTRLIVNSRKGL